MSLTIEQTAAQWLEDEAQRMNRAERASLQLGPSRWVLPRLLRIVDRNQEQNIEVLAPLIRSMLRDQAFANTGNEPCDCEQLEEAIDKTVGLLIRVLERVRAYTLTHEPTA